MTDYKPPEPTIRITLPDVSVPGQRVDVGYVEAIGDEDRNFRLVINPARRQEVGERLEDVLFTFNGPADDTVSASAGSVKERLIYSVRWIVGGFCLCVALLSFDSENADTIPFFLAMTLVTLPPVDYFLARRNIRLNTWHRCAIVLLSFAVMAFFSDGTPPSPDVITP